MIVKQPLISIVVAVIFILGLANNIYAPSFPVMREAFQTSTQSIQFSITIYYCGLMLGLLFLGPISDAFGRRKPLLLGLACFFVTSLLCGFSKTIEVFLLLRGIQGLGAAFLGISFRSIPGDALSGKELSKAMSYVYAGYRFGPVIAPFIGGYLQMFLGWQSNFFALAAYIAFVFYLVLFHLRETLPERIPMDWKGTMGKYRKILSNRSFLGASICCGIQYGMLLIVNIFGSFFIQDVLGFAPVEYGHIACAIGIFILGGVACNRFLLPHFSDTKLIFFGVVINVFLAVVQVGLAFAFPKNLWSFIAPVSAILFTIGFVSSNMLSHAINLIPKSKGTAGALQGLIAISITMVVTASVLFLSTKTILPFALLYGGLSLCVFVFHKWVFLKGEPET